MTELQKENNSLRERVTILERGADTAEQYSRRNCLRISGVPAQTVEDTDDYVVQMSQPIGANLSNQDIDRSHLKSAGKIDRCRSFNGTFLWRTLV